MPKNCLFLSEKILGRFQNDSEFNCAIELSDHQSQFLEPAMRRLLFAALFLCSAIAYAGNDQVMAVFKNNATNFKDRALAFCIAQAYGDSPAGRDAGKTSSVYLDLTQFDLDSNTKLFALINKYLGRDYYLPFEGYEDAKFDLLKCIDMYHSPELDALVRKYVSHPTWIGNNPPENRRK
jgi:hypothetical protein